jgi:hypothetical protein
MLKISISVIRFAVKLVSVADVQHQKHARVIRALEKIPKININAMRSAVKLVSTVDVQLLRHVPAIQAF